MLEDNFKGKYSVGQNIRNKQIQVFVVVVVFIQMIKQDKESKAFWGMDGKQNDELDKRMDLHIILYTC